MRRLTIILALSLAAVAVSAQSALAAGSWTAAKIPSTGNNVLLEGVFARTNSDAWAVGQQFPDADQPPAPAAAYHWNGRKWSLTATPNVGTPDALEAVSASRANDAWAVGFTSLAPRDHGTLIEHWNGSTWSVESLNARAGQGVGLTGVVDLRPDDAWAVGFGGTGLIEHWNGEAWSVVTIPDPNFTPASHNAISAVSAKDIWVVGAAVDSATGASALEALHFNGTSWTPVPLQEPNATSVNINSLTAISANDIWAVGETAGGSSASDGSTLIEHFNGSDWSIVPSPTPGAVPMLTGVAGRSATDAYAVGTNEPSVTGGSEHVMILR